MPHTAEGGAEISATFGQVAVMLLALDATHAAGPQGGEISGGSRILAGRNPTGPGRREAGFGMQAEAELSLRVGRRFDPRRIGFRREHPHPRAAVVLHSVDHGLDRPRPRRRQAQRGQNRQHLEDPPVRVDRLAGGEHDLDQPGGRHDRLAGDAMFGKPGGLARDGEVGVELAACQRRAQPGPEQRMGPAHAAAHLPGLADRGADPVAAALERIARRIDLAAPIVAVPAGPVELGTGGVEFLHRLAECVPLVGAGALEARQVAVPRLFGTWHLCR